MGSGSMRNKKCACGSGRKYKYCCYSSKTSFEELKIARRLDEIRKISAPKECFCKTWGKCSEKIIKAHSIQNNRVLNKISSEGDVCMFGMDVKAFNSDQGGMAMQVVGRKIASTFNGFCSHHDGTIFSPIDNYDYVWGNKEQEFLYAFRALSFELYKKKHIKNIFENIINDLDNTGPIDLFKNFLAGNNNAISYIEGYFEIFEKAIREKKFDNINTVLLELSDEYLLGVNSMFGLEYDLKGKRTNDISDWNQPVKPIFINVYPQKGKTKIIISWLKKHDHVFSDFGKQLDELSENDKIKVINNIMISYIENFAINPKIWDKFTKEDKENIDKLRSELAISMVDKDTILRDMNVSLFRKT